jgi:hypothetical protein
MRSRLIVAVASMAVLALAFPAAERSDVAGQLRTYEVTLTNRATSQPISLRFMSPMIETSGFQDQDDRGRASPETNSHMCVSPRATMGSETACSRRAKTRKGRASTWMAAETT